jgi:hypothetical protein
MENLNMNKITTQYVFTVPNGAEHRFLIEQDGTTLELLDETRGDLPAWTLLENKRCDHCPLDPGSHRHCPAAARISAVASRFGELASYTEVKLSVIRDQRTVSLNTTLQRGMGSLLGLIIACSGCPHSLFFRPMARFHLPVADEEETVYRATSTYLLAQYYRHHETGMIDLDLTGLKQIYQDMQIVNSGLAMRLRCAGETDSSVNAIVLLDLFAKAMPYVIEERLDGLRYLLAPFLGHHHEQSLRKP